MNSKIEQAPTFETHKITLLLHLGVLKNIGVVFDISIQACYWTAATSSKNSSFRLEDLDSLPGEVRIITSKVTVSSSLLVPEVSSSQQV